MANLMTIFGAMAMAGGSMMYFTFPIGLEFGLKTMINLKESGMVYPLYIAPPFSTDSTYYIYELKNPREFLKGKKMRLNLKGPYKYKAKIERANVAFTRSQDIIQYETGRKLVLNEKDSADLDEKFWMLNPIVPGVVKTVRGLIIDRVPFKVVTEPVVFNAVNVLLNTYNEHLVAKVTPRELLEGRKVEMIESLMGLAGRFGLQSLVPPGPPDNVFGLAYVQNETIDKLEVWTGVATKEKFADVHKWRGKPVMDVWSGACNKIEGTNGELYKPLIDRDKPIRVFLPQVCRSFDMDPVSEDEVIVMPNGLNAIEFEISSSIFMGAKSNPANRCYCKNMRAYDCQYDGLLSMGPCFFDAPIFFASANFDQLDRRIKNLLNEDTLNMNISSVKKSFYLDQTTGTLLGADLNLVAFIKTVKQPYLSDTSSIPNLTYAPLALIQESAVVPFHLVWQVGALQILTDIYKPASIGIALSGAALILMRFIFKGRGRVNKPVDGQNNPPQ